jgi:antitoxin FitA
MSTTMIQIRNVPGEIHRKAKARAALSGLTLSEFALQALQRELARPTMSEVAARIRTLEPVPEAPPASAIIREERAAR